MMASQIRRMPSSLSRMRRGVNPSLTSRRRRTCSGASKSIIIGSGVALGSDAAGVGEGLGVLGDLLDVGVAGDAPHPGRLVEVGGCLAAHPGERREGVAAVEGAVGQADVQVGGGVVVMVLLLVGWWATAGPATDDGARLPGTAKDTAVSDGASAAWPTFRRYAGPTMPPPSSALAGRWRGFAGEHPARYTRDVPREEQSARWRRPPSRQAAVRRAERCRRPPSSAQSSRSPLTSTVIVSPSSTRLRWGRPAAPRGRRGR